MQDNTIDNKNLMFPWGVYLGDLSHHERADDIPVLIPSSQGGFIIQYDNHSEQQCHSFIESVCLSLASVIKPSLLEFHIFDYSHQKRFGYLSELKQQGWYHIYFNATQAEYGFNQLEAESLDRHHNRLSASTPDIGLYNQNTPKRPLVYHLLIINLEHFPDERVSAKRLASFISSAMTAGFYVIGFSSQSLEADIHNNHQLALYQSLPKLILKQQKFELTAELFAQSELQTQYGFEFHMIEQNNLFAIKQLQQSQQQDTSTNETDFLQIPIAKSHDGIHDIEFRLGSACDNYHVIITGSTGTGKSVLLNNLITSIAERYTADEIRLDLMDFKQGVEFQAFVNHPNVEHLFLENADKQSAIDLLANFVTQGQSLGTLFRQTGVRNIDEYNLKHPEQALPHRLLIIDEVQNLYEGMSYRQQEVLNKHLDNILRQGRSWGNHLIICTQTLKGTLLPKDAIQSQAKLRITLALTREADAMETMGASNAKVATHLQKHELLINTAGGDDPSANKTGFANPPKDIEATLTAVRLRRQRHQMTQPMVMGGSANSFDNDRANQATQDNLQNNLQNNQHDNKPVNQYDNQQDTANKANSNASNTNMTDDTVDEVGLDIFAGKEAFIEKCFAQWDKERKS